MAMATTVAASTAVAMGSLELEPVHARWPTACWKAWTCSPTPAPPLRADGTRCRAQAENGTAAATALLPLIGYAQAAALAAEAAPALASRPRRSPRAC